MRVANAQRVVQAQRGGSKPFLISCDDGQDYVVKFQDNPQGHRILINEVLAHALARHIDLPIAEAAIIWTDCKFFKENRDIGASLGIKTELIASGPQFGSRFVARPFQGGAFTFLSDKSLLKLQNRDKFVDILVFDIYSGNLDRRQFIFCREKKNGPLRATMIDQGYCFGGNSWELGEIGYSKPYAQNCVYDDVHCFDNFEHVLERFEHLDDKVIEEAAECIPEEWLRGNVTDFRRLLCKLKSRRLKLPFLIRDLVESSHNPFRRWGKGQPHAV